MDRDGKDPSKGFADLEHVGGRSNSCVSVSCVGGNKVVKPLGLNRDLGGERQWLRRHRSRRTRADPLSIIFYRDWNAWN